MQSLFRLVLITLLWVSTLAGCSQSRAPQSEESPTPINPAAPPTSLTVKPSPPDPIEAARQTLASLKKVDDFPLYTMTYTSVYTYSVSQVDAAKAGKAPAPNPWACSLIAALGDPGSRLYGRNFDWEFSPALLLFNYPPDGYASVSMVDLAYLVDLRDANRLTDLPIEQRRALLEAPFIPFDGMNSAGLAVGMAAVPAGNVAPDPDKPAIDSILILREVLDHAGTVDEAAAIFQKYNIAWGSAPAMHYLIADRSGQAILVEYSGDQMVQIRNQDTWLVATNFIVNQAGEHPEEKCWRFQRISQRLSETGGKLDVPEAMRLLSEVSQTSSGSSTQWSVVYDTSRAEVHVVVGQQYEKVYTFSLASDP